MEKEQRNDLIRLLLAGLLLLGAALIPKPGSVTFMFYIPAYLLAGYEVLISTVKNLLHGDLLDEDFLMTAASVGAFIIGEYPEAVAVMLLFGIGEWFEDLAVERSRKSITSLTGLRPDTARVISNGTAAIVAPEEVKVSDRILVQPGERIPLDGKVDSGCCELDVSALTGEAVPVSVGPGDTVSSGSIVLNAILTVEVTKTYDDSTATRIVKLVEESESSKSRSEAFTTRFARVYTPLVCIAALLLALAPSLITGDWKTWVYRGLLFLVVSCPCALVISVPLSFFAGIGGAAKRGILVKGGQFLEVLAKANCAVFDKTGTLTDGKLVIAEILPEAGITEEELLSFTASAEQYSSHPIAVCICRAAGALLPAQSVTEQAGKGVSALVDGKRIIAGNKKLAAENGLSANDVSASGGTAVYTFMDGRYIGRITVGDSVKENASAAVKRMRTLGFDELALLTGDTLPAAQRIADEIGLSSFSAELMPEEKVTALEHIMHSAKGRITIYTGDGINDAPVLARADAGIAMGALGADAAIEAADVVLMDDDPMKLPLAVSLSRMTVKIVKENIAFALLAKTLVLLLGALGLANMWLAVFADVGVTAIAVLNSVRCLRTDGI